MENNFFVTSGYTRYFYEDENKKLLLDDYQPENPLVINLNKITKFDFIEEIDEKKNKKYYKIFLGLNEYLEVEDIDFKRIIKKIKISDQLPKKFMMNF